LQAVLVPDAAEALRGIRYLQQSNSGRGTFLPLASARTKADCAPLREVATEEPKVKGLLSDFYRVSGPHADRIKASLPDALLLESLEDALDVIARRGPVPCVTLAGETARGAMVEGGRGVKGLLAPRREAREAAERLAVAEAQLLAARARVAEEASAAQAAEAETRALEERIHGIEKDVVAIQHDLQVATEADQRMERKAAVLESERAQAEQEKSASALKLAEIAYALEQAEAERARAHEELQLLAAALHDARTATEAAQARSAEAKSRLAVLRERVAAAEADVKRLFGEHEELVGRIAGAESRSGEMRKRKEQLLLEIAECERLLASALTDRDRATGEVAVAEDKVRERRLELESREQALKERRREREMLKDALSELEVGRARAESDLDHLARECHQAVGQTAAEAALRLTDEERVRELPALEQQIGELRERLERMGQVNVLAVEQAQELDERHTFLVAQRQDLLDSIAELDRAIRTIDKASKERFREAFQVINERFGEVFRQLFGGGTAGLSLIDEEDLLESGIDIMAQPPGKRLQNVMLLSGGEKALTAISLLFAIFQYKPSPFCILDEVDAPLDDANIGRFAKMLEGMKDHTQFVLITHSRKTMEIADQLYGVTMEEPGVSKLVSVRFS
jgi:chromosome segregation protein